MLNRLMKLFLSLLMLATFFLLNAGNVSASDLEVFENEEKEITNDPEVEKINEVSESVQLDSSIAYINADLNSNLKVTLEYDDGDYLNIYKFDSKIYAVSSNGEKKEIASITNQLETPGVSMYIADNWNAAGYYKTKVNIPLRNLTSDICFAIVTAAIPYNKVALAANIGYTLYNYVTSARQEYIYISYNQTSWRGCPIFIKTWNIRTYGSSSYSGTPIASDDRVKLSWLGHPQLNQYRAGCHDAAAKYW